MEVEENRELPFLDVLVKRNNDKLEYSVYRKKTHTDKYLHYLSNHHQSVKNSVASSFYRRARDICDDHNRTLEIKHLRQVLSENGYPVKLINRIQRNAFHPKDRNEEKEKSKHTVCIPFIPGLSNQISRILKQTDIKTYFTSRSNTLQSMLVRLKDPCPSQQKSGVYNIPCQCGMCYIGHTARTLSVRPKEHERSIVNIRNPSKTNPNSAVAFHVMESDYSYRMLWKDAKIIASVSNPFVRRTREALEISIDSNTINSKDGADFPAIWKIALNKC
ncbi:Uncharacterised protein r2_g2253 [Pycnogonum litorale]